MQIKVAIADDHTMFLMGLKNLLQGLDDLTVVGTASDEVELKELLEKEVIDVLLLDIDFGRSDGIELCAALSKNKADLQILGLSMHKEGLIIDKMLKAGAKGYILKDYGAEEIEQAVQTVQAGGQFLSPKAHTALQEYKFSSSKEKQVAISKREKDVLALIMEEMTTAEIADQLCISKHTVETHRGNLFLKFEVRNLAGLVKKTIELNLLQS